MPISLDRSPLVIFLKANKYTANALLVAKLARAYLGMSKVLASMTAYHFFINRKKSSSVHYTKILDGNLRPKP